jgi:hypothetical protein
VRVVLNREGKENETEGRAAPAVRAAGADLTVKEERSESESF